jgi:hypothetical protein
LGECNRVPGLGVAYSADRVRKSGPASSPPVQVAQVDQDGADAAADLAFFGEPEFGEDGVDVFSIADSDRCRLSPMAALVLPSASR